jgi:alkanesulfonate monooxygenase SsuD/methylene tetrahydromethanopterin reductase-like flavin-dependent oxidoreductase (luciferase family)
MRFGFALPQIGSIAGPEALVMVAKRAEDLGYDSLWVLDRILWPVSPRAPYPIGDGSLPVQYKNVLDPVETLTFAAAQRAASLWQPVCSTFPGTIRFCWPGG